MDIAKIRKKLKNLEAENQQPKTDDQKGKPAEDNSLQAEERAQEPSGTEDRTRTEDQPLADSITRPDENISEAKVLKELKEREEKAQAPKTEKRVEPEKEEEVVEILTFKLRKEEFAFRISQLAEILRHQMITKVPKVPDYVLGVTSLRGKIIPVIDLKLKLSLSEGPTANERKGKILIINGPKGPIGAAVDKVIGVVRIEKSEILPPPSHLSEKGLKFIDGVAIVDKRFVSIINMEETVSLRSQ